MFGAKNKATICLLDLLVIVGWAQMKKTPKSVVNCQLICQ